MKSSRQIIPLHPKRDIVSLRSDDGALEFRLSAAAEGLFVERIQEQGKGACVVQTTLFRDANSFQRWCDADDVRFAYPVVFVNLKRNGDRVLQRG